MVVLLDSSSASGFYRSVAKKSRDHTCPTFLIIGIFPDFLIPICRVTQGKGVCCKVKQNRCHGVETGGRKKMEVRKL